MKSLFFWVLLASATVAGNAADTRSVSGTWKIHSNIAGYESDLSCTLSQKDTDLTGTCTTEQGEVRVSGKVAGQKVGWIYKSEYNGGPITLTYSGVLDPAGLIKGTVNVQEYSVDGEFTATRSN